MAKKTGGQIELEVYTLWQAAISAQIGGTVYLRGTRPLDSVAEDAVISFMTGLDDQVQTGALNINIYVPNLTIKDYPKPIKDITRCNAIESFMLNLIEDNHVTSEYKFTLGQTINTFAEDEINQHFVNVKLKYKRLTI